MDSFLNVISGADGAIRRRLIAANIFFITIALLYYDSDKITTYIDSLSNLNIGFLFLIALIFFAVGSIFDLFGELYLAALFGEVAHAVYTINNWLRKRGILRFLLMLPVYYISIHLLYLAIFLPLFRRSRFKIFKTGQGEKDPSIPESTIRFLDKLPENIVSGLQFPFRREFLFSWDVLEHSLPPELRLKTQRQYREFREILCIISSLLVSIFVIFLSSIEILPEGQINRIDQTILGGDLIKINQSVYTAFYIYIMVGSILFYMLLLAYFSKLKSSVLYLINIAANHELELTSRGYKEA